MKMFFSSPNAVEEKEKEGGLDKVLCKLCQRGYLEVVKEKRKKKYMITEVITGKRFSKGSYLYTSKGVPRKYKTSGTHYLCEECLEVQKRREAEYKELKQRGKEEKDTTESERIDILNRVIGIINHHGKVSQCSITDRDNPYRDFDAGYVTACLEIHKEVLNIVDDK